MSEKQAVMKTALRKVRKFFPQVDTVVDADRAVNIHVDAADTALAKKKDHNHCALAIACQHKMKADGVIISMTTAYVVKGTKATRFKLNETTSREIVSFDRNGGFEEGDYRIIPPPPGARLGAKGHKNGKTGPHTGPKKPTPHVTTNVRTSLKTVENDR